MQMTKFAFLWILLLAAVHASGQDACTAIIGRDQQELSRVMNGWRSPVESDNRTEDVRRFAAARGSRCLGAIRGDFDGDGARDLAVLLVKNSDSSQVAAVVVWGRRLRDRVVVVDTWTDADRVDMSIGTVPPGSYTRTLSADPCCERDEVGKINSSREGLVAGYFESATQAYFYRNGRWVWLQLTE